MEEAKVHQQKDGQEILATYTQWPVIQPKSTTGPLQTVDAPREGHTE